MTPPHTHTQNHETKTARSSNTRQRCAPMDTRWCQSTSPFPLWSNVHNCLTAVWHGVNQLEAPSSFFSNSFPQFIYIIWFCFRNGPFDVTPLEFRVLGISSQLSMALGPRKKQLYSHQSTKGLFGSLRFS